MARSKEGWKLPGMKPRERGVAVWQMPQLWLCLLCGAIDQPQKLDAYTFFHHV